MVESVVIKPDKEEKVKYYHVGGSVRDWLIKAQPHDFDFAVEAPSFAQMKLDLEKRGLSLYQCKEEFGIVRASTRDQLGHSFLVCSAFPLVTSAKCKSADFVLCRKDGLYRDHRHPDDIKVGTLKDDLQRRDFTVNAMAFDPVSNQLIDPFGGECDLKDKLLRCVGDTPTRMQEDALRMVRAIRFCVTKGFKMHADLHAFLLDTKNAQLLNVISPERLAV